MNGLETGWTEPHFRGSPMSLTNMEQRPANVVRWDPFEDLEHLQQQLAQVFPSWPRRPAWPQTGTAMDSESAPVADVEETNDAFVVEIELAGVKKQDVKIELSGRRLTGTGERKERQREGTLRRRTRTVGRFRYEMSCRSMWTPRKSKRPSTKGSSPSASPKPLPSPSTSTSAKGDQRSGRHVGRKES